MSIGFLERTIIQTHDPKYGDRYVQILGIDGVTLTPDPQTPLLIDGETWNVVRCSVEIDMQRRMVTTTVTAVRERR